MVVAAVVTVVLVGGGGAAGACKFFLNCGLGDFYFHHPAPISVSDFAGKGAGNMKLPPDLGVVVFAKGLRYPTDLAFLPDGSLLVAQKNGLITAVRKRGTSGSTFLDLRAKVNTSYFRGLMSVAVDPDFSAHPYVYVTYTSIGEGGASTAPTVMRVSRFTVSGKAADPGSEHVIVGRAGTTSCLSIDRLANCLPSEVDHDGSATVFAPDGTMFISTGDGGGKEHVEEAALRAQDIDTLGGKVLHVDRDGHGLPGNPFWNGNPLSNRSRVWAFGLRNPFRLTLLQGGEAPLVADVGWRTWERLVFAARGANLGWPCFEALQRTEQYNGTQFCTTFYRSHPVAPTAPWLTIRHPAAISITGGVSLRDASALPERYRDMYIFGDWATSKISLLPLGNEPKPEVPVVLAKNGAGPVAFAVGPDGALYYAAVNVGQIRRIAAAGR